MFAFLQSFMFILIAEMGDKSQLLVMTLATQYKVLHVFLGMSVAIFALNGMAVLLGTYLAGVIPMGLVKTLAAGSFIYFGYTSLNCAEEDDEGKCRVGIHPIITVALTFLLAEFGDKTQLTTVALAARFQAPLWVLAGAALGMIIADSLGIFAGGLLTKRFSGGAIRWVSGMVLMAFGAITLYEISVVGALALGLACVVIWYRSWKLRRIGQITGEQRQSA